MLPTRNTHVCPATVLNYLLLAWALGDVTQCLALEDLLGDMGNRRFCTIPQCAMGEKFLACGGPEVRRPKGVGRFIIGVAVTLSRTLSRMPSVRYCIPLPHGESSG